MSKKEKEWKLIDGGMGWADQPLPVALGAVVVEALDGDGHAAAGPGGGHGGLVDPALEDGSEAAFAEHAVGAEVAGGGLEVGEGEAVEVGGEEDVGLVAQDEGEGRGGSSAAAAVVCGCGCGFCGCVRASASASACASNSSENVCVAELVSSREAAREGEKQQEKESNLRRQRRGRASRPWPIARCSSSPSLLASFNQSTKACLPILNFYMPASQVSPGGC